MHEQQLSILLFLSATEQVSVGGMLPVEALSSMHASILAYLLTALRRFMRLTLQKI